MAKKAPKQPPHLRIRIDPKLVARLERAREMKGNTLTGEIVSRLEESFSTDDKLALQKEALRQGYRAIEEDMNKRSGEQAAQLQQLLVDQARFATGQLILQFVLGDDPTAKQTVRTVALLLATKPWLAQQVDAAIKTIEGSSK
jgi:hypothetical protein